jgi:hypothetical protein
MPSWNRREADDGGGQWPSGQLGLFGLVELFVCIENCLNLDKDVFVFPYVHGLGTQSDSIRAAIDFLGADPILFNPNRFTSRQEFREAKRRSSDVMSSRVALQNYEKEILEVLRVRDLDALMDKRSGLRVSEIAKPLRDYLESITGNLAAAFDCAFSNAASPTMETFAGEYFNRHRVELADFLKRTSDSTAIGQFQRFGVYQRFKAIFLQPSVWKRRLPLFRARLPSFDERL